MGYLDNSSITVDAVLTKKGREILKNGGALNIVNFTASDTGVSYDLWNADHPDGSAYYGEAIENLPMLEASVHASQAIRNRLISLPENTITVPALQLGLPDTDNNTVSFEDGDANSHKTATVYLKGYSPQFSTPLPLYLIVNSPQILHISNAQLESEMDGLVRDYVRESDLQRAKVYKLLSAPDGINTEWYLKMTPDLTQKVAGREALITVIEPITGGFNSFVARNNVTDISRNILSSIPKGS